MRGSDHSRKRVAAPRERKPQPFDERAVGERLVAVAAPAQQGQLRQAQQLREGERLVGAALCGVGQAELGERGFARSSACGAAPRRAGARRRRGRRRRANGRSMARANGVMMTSARSAIGRRLGRKLACSSTLSTQPHELVRGSSSRRAAAPTGSARRRRSRCSWPQAPGGRRRRRCKRRPHPGGLRAPATMRSQPGGERQAARGAERREQAATRRPTGCAPARRAPRRARFVTRTRW